MMSSLPAGRHPHPAPCAAHLPGEPVTAHEATATATPERAALLSTTTRDPLGPRPSLAYRAATASLSHGRWLVQEPAKVAVSWHGAGKNCGRAETPPAATLSRPRPGTMW